MNLLYVIPFVLAILLFFIARLIYIRHQSAILRRNLQIVGAIFCVFSIAAIGMAYYVSGDRSHLFKIALPTLILIILFEQIKRQKRKGNKE
ncbi:MAG: hypothetical protein ABIV51_02065 [Saprospiraceae bacterium]